MTDTSMASDKSAAFSDAFKRVRFVMFCMFLPPLLSFVDTAVVKLYLQPDPPRPAIEKSENGQFYWPRNLVEVVQGTLVAAPEGYENWLVTDKGGKVWPKYDLGAEGGFFSIDYEEPSRRYHIVAVRVSKQTSADWLAWRQDSEKSGVWRPVVLPEEYEVLLRIKLYR